MDIQQQVIGILDQTLGLKGRGQSFTAETPLLGALPEFDSMAVVGVITALEERFDITVEDDEIEGETFTSVGSLVKFVEQKL